MLDSFCDVAQFLTTLKSGRVKKLQLYCGAQKSLPVIVCFIALAIVLFLYGVSLWNGYYSSPEREPPFYGNMDGFSAFLDILFYTLVVSLVIISYWLLRIAMASNWRTRFTEARIKQVIENLDPAFIEELSITGMPLQVNHVPDVLGKFTSLKRLTLSGSAGLATLPASLSECKKLERIDLYGCAGLAMLPDLSNTEIGKKIAEEGFDSYKKLFHGINTDLLDAWAKGKCSQQGPSKRYYGQRLMVSCDGSACRMTYPTGNSSKRRCKRCCSCAYQVIELASGVCGPNGRAIGQGIVVVVALLYIALFVLAYTDITSGGSKSSLIG